MGDYSKIAYEFYKRNNICTQCRKRKTDGTRVTCDRCHSMNRSRKEKEKEERRKARNLCYKCGSKVREMNSLCDECYEGIEIPIYIRSKSGKQ